MFENLAIHYVDFLLNYSDFERFSSYFSSFIDGVPSTFDFIASSCSSSLISKVHCSYSEIFSDICSITFDNGLLCLDSDSLNLFSPLLKIDPTTNLSVAPQPIFSSDMGMSKLFADSLETSILSFLNLCIEIDNDNGSHPGIANITDSKDHRIINLISEILSVPDRLYFVLFSIHLIVFF